MSLFHSLLRRELVPMPVHTRPFIADFSHAATRGAGIVRIAPPDESGEQIGVPPFAVKFSKTAKAGRLIAVADEEGYLTLIDSTKALPQEVFGSEYNPEAQWLAHQNAVFDTAWSQGDTQLLTASGDQTVKVWDVETQRQILCARGHTGSVKTVSLNSANESIFASGGRDGAILLWDQRMLNGGASSSAGPVASLQDAHGEKKKTRGRKSDIKSRTRASITSVLFLHDDSTLASSSTVDGVVKVWDVRRLDRPALLSSRCRADTEGSMRSHGIASLAQDPSRSRLVASSSNGVISMYDSLRPEIGPIRQFTGHQFSLYIKVAFSCDGTHLVSGSGDKNVYIWQVDRPDLEPYTLQGHEGEVSGVDWCGQDFGTIATCGDDSTVRVWQMSDAHRGSRAVLPRAASISGTSADTSAREADCHGAVHADAGPSHRDVSMLEAARERGQFPLCTPATSVAHHASPRQVLLATGPATHCTLETEAEPLAETSPAAAHGRHRSLRELFPALASPSPPAGARPGAQCTGGSEGHRGASPLGELGARATEAGDMAEVEKALGGPFGMIRGPTTPEPRVLMEEEPAVTPMAAADDRAVASTKRDRAVNDGLSASLKQLSVQPTSKKSKLTKSPEEASQQRTLNDFFPVLAT
ncbi:hypothetical protein CYMTET_52876 [Cymbomonas tetramitiformis]|uniref:Denticleless protein homolog n=1 Tax=Cymbomonas tetramitiformis TaxID=36881 RepID=A0AAE0BID7_9CHLO|nr:hypothetical protein CYMTET_52876 [Cymbomonas tetramitiformis]